MEKTTKQEIDKFLDCETIVVAGASRNENSFSASAINHLQSKGYTVLSVNPNFKENNPVRKEYKSLTEIPDGMNNLLLLTSPMQTTYVIKQAIERGIKNIWIQQKSETPEALKLCLENNINLIHHLCIFMFTQPGGIHKFHFGMKSIFRTLPR